MAQRLVRAKRRLRVAGIGLRESPSPVLPERLDQVIAVLYLIFNEGYAASSGDSPVRHELCGEAIRLAQILASLLPGEPEPAGLAALMLFQHARAPARIGADGDARPARRPGPAAVGRRPHRPGRDRDPRRRGSRVGRRVLPPGGDRPRARPAATAAATDWQAIAALYAELAAVSPSPVLT